MLELLGLLGVLAIGLVAYSLLVGRRVIDDRDRLEPASGGVGDDADRREKLGACCGFGLPPTSGVTVRDRPGGQVEMGTVAVDYGLGGKEEMAEIEMTAKPAGRVQVFNPPMCCSTGVCGPAVDPVLVRFAADLAWLRAQGVTVSRYNLSQQPGAFAANETVRARIAGEGVDCLPLLLVDGRVVSRRPYPTRDQLAGWVGLTSSSPAL